MGRKKILERRQARLEAKKADLAQRAMDSQDANEVRAINEQLQEIADDLQDIKDEIQAIVDEENADNAGADERAQVPANAEMRGVNPLASFPQGTQARTSEAPFSSVEYRQAFKAYAQRGVEIPADVMTRAAGEAGTTVSADLGVIIPQTIMNEFIKDVQKVYGHVYSKVRKLNVKGGVSFPVSKLKASFKWVGATEGASEKVKAGDVKDKVSFGYNLGEIRIATSLVAQTVSLESFEQEIVKLMLEAYLEAMDKGIVAGSGNNELLGITKDTRVTSNTPNIIEMNETEFGDWTAWRKNVFAKVPLSKRGQCEFMFPASTVETYLMSMKDAANRPVFKEAAEITMDNTSGSFFGRPVSLVEPDVIEDFATADAGDVVGILWVPSDYAINSNLAFGMKRYFDEDTNEWINKGLTIVDGKILDVSGCFLIKKKA